MNIDYPKEWDELPKRDRKRKIRELKRESLAKDKRKSKQRNVALGLLIIVTVVGSLWFFNKKSPEEIAQETKLKEEIKSVSLEGLVEEFEIEGRDHVSPGTNVEYTTNPPTSGDHLAQAESWGVYSKEIDDKAAVHSLEHGGIWISYKDLSEEEIKTLEDIGKKNSQSTVVSPRSANDNKIVIASWGKMMKLEEANEALIQKYIDTYKNQSPERLAR